MGPRTHRARNSWADAARVAEQAALAGAEVIRDALQGHRQVRLKGAVDLVTQVDLAAEAAVLAVLERLSPGVPVLAEERGGALHSTTRWIVDPLDGTTNFVHGFPAFVVAVALQDAGQVVAACTMDPLHGHRYRAWRGGGAWAGDHRLAVSDVDTLSEALLLTGFPYDRRERAAHYLSFVQAFMERVQGIRRAGSAANDLVQIASGHADGFWELGLHSWDVAGGTLLVEEAGGRITDMGGGPLDLDAPRLLATNGRIHEPMLEVLDSLLSSSSG